RGTDPRLLEEARRRWHSFYRATSALPTLRVFWLDRFEKPKTLFNALRAQENVACLALTFPCDGASLDLWTEALMAGIPVAVWVRGVIDQVPEDLRQWLEAILQGGDPPQAPEELPRRVRAARREAENAAARHPGTGLSLLWDDPGRSLPQGPDLVSV